VSDYLWDKSGAPDPEIQRLEELLSGFAYEPKKPVRRWRAARYLAAAACLIAAAGVGAWLWKLQGPSWDVASLAGAPRIGSASIPATGRLRPGQWLQTDSASRARVEIGGIGDVEIAPNSRVSMVRSRATEQRMALDRGRIRASIYAPPRIFIVDTPSATAVDLGCVYTLDVGEDGSGLLHVIAGWVSIEAHGRESLIPARAICESRKGKSPGTPYFEDAPEALVSALRRFDFADAGYEALREILAAARPRDGLTLWHLLSRASGTDREAVYYRLAALNPPPEGVTREGALTNDSAMLEAWWNSLGLGDASWWRKWKPRVVE
jgi:hypothetical protein